MGPEQRWCERKPVELDVTVYDSRLGIVHGKTKNISLEGMYIETGMVSLPKNSLLEVAFQVNNDKGDQLHRVQALVAHCDDRGAGLMLVHSHAGAINAINTVMEGRGSAAIGAQA